MGGWVWGCSLNCFFFFISIACLMSLCVPMETKQNIPRPLPRPISPPPPPPPPTSSPSSTRYQRIFTVLSRQRRRLPVLILCAAVSRAAPLRSTHRSRPNGFSFFSFFSHCGGESCAQRSPGEIPQKIFSCQVQSRPGVSR